MLCDNKYYSQLWSQVKICRRRLLWILKIPIQPGMVKTCECKYPFLNVSKISLYDTDLFLQLQGIKVHEMIRLNGSITGSIIL